MLHEYMARSKRWGKHKTSWEMESREKKSCHKSEISPLGANCNRYVDTQNFEFLMEGLYEAFQTS